MIKSFDVHFQLNGFISIEAESVDMPRWFKKGAF